MNCRSLRIDIEQIAVRYRSADGQASLLLAWVLIFLGHIGDEPACRLTAFAAREDVGRAVDPDFVDGCCAASQGRPAVHSPRVDFRHGRLWFPPDAYAPVRVTVGLRHWVAAVEPWAGKLITKPGL